VARLGRYFLPEQPIHVIQRGNNRQPVFFADDDHARYREWLAEAAAASGCDAYAYVLMTNHVHLLVAGRTPESIPRTMQSLGRRYVRSVNVTHRRTGTLWEGRYRAAPIDGERYFMACSRYIELNPVRARMARHPRDYRWSSYRAHAEGAPDDLLTEHAGYASLGRTAAERWQAYRALFRGALDAQFVADIRAATNGGWALGDEAFRRAVAKAAGRRAAPLPRGRRPKAPEPAGRRQLNLF
jgi:putative transposase